MYTIHGEESIDVQDLTFRIAVFYSLYSAFVWGGGCVCNYLHGHNIIAYAATEHM